MYRPFDTQGISGRAAGDGEVDCSAGPLQGAGRRGRAALPGHHDGAGGERGQAAVRRMPTVIGGRYGLSSKEFTPAMVKGIFDELTQAGAEEPLHDRHQRRCEPFEPGVRSRVFDRRSEDGASVVLRARLGRNGGREQEFDQDYRQRDAELRAGLLCLRLEEVGVDDDVAPAVRAESDPVDLPDYPRQLCGLP